MPRRSDRYHQPKDQHGFVLVTALIFLIVLSVLGTMAMRGSLFEERMSANDRDLATAREYAELALRDAERDILGLRFDGAYCATAPCNTLRPVGTRPANAVSAQNYWSNPDSEASTDIALADGGLLTGDLSRQGVYSSDAARECGMPIWSGADWNDNANPARSCAGTINAAVPTIEYGTFTDAPFVGPDENPPNGIPRPRYLIEYFELEKLTGSSTQKKLFRITAVGFGRTVGPNGRTSVTLQSVFSPL